MYAENILEHYKNPHHCGRLDNATVSVKEVNPLCGDIYQVDLKFSKDGIVEDAGFTGKGCAISTAALSMLMDEIIGKLTTEVKKLEKENMYELLGVDISAARVKCAVIGLVGVKNAIRLYKPKQ